MSKRVLQSVLPEYDKTHVGRRFRLLRMARRMTVREWATVIGERCTPQKICNYEAGVDQLPIVYAARACVLTGASFDYIYRGMMKPLPKELLLQIAQIEDHLRVQGNRKSAHGDTRQQG